MKTRCTAAAHTQHNEQTNNASSTQYMPACVVKISKSKNERLLLDRARNVCGLLQVSTTQQMVELTADRRVWIYFFIERNQRTGDLESGEEIEKHEKHEKRHSSHDKPLDTIHTLYRSTSNVPGAKKRVAHSKNQQLRHLYMIRLLPLLLLYYDSHRYGCTYFLVCAK